MNGLLRFLSRKEVIEKEKKTMEDIPAVHQLALQQGVGGEGEVRHNFFLKNN